ncbi:MAG: D-alanyl-D-alanine carboxypeptidase/D-alanyl-D-alanine-endopeptidase [Rhodoferax sp.]
MDGEFVRLMLCFRKALIGVLLCLGQASGVLCAPAGLPEPVAAALRAAQLPPSALSLWIGSAQTPASALAEHQADKAMNPASVMKLLTTFAGLDLLGPDYRWHTLVWLDGPTRDGRLQGNLVIQGQGDPTLVTERLWLLLRRVRGLGIQHIDGDIVLDRSRLTIPVQDPGDFDGEPLRAYNVQPDALLINYGAIALYFTPDPRAGVARVHMEPPLADVRFPPSIALSPPDTSCADWRAALRADFDDPVQIRLAGSFPAACGEKVWHLAYREPREYAQRALRGMWSQLGGSLGGHVRDGAAPARAPDLDLSSRPLAEVIRDINKFSNNVMAQQLFLTMGSLADAPPGPDTPTRARARLQRWWRDRGLGEPEPIIDNGAGLSRSAQLSARGLAALLRQAWTSPWMPELIASLPITGVDGTLRSHAAAAGRAHLKTGSLAQVLSIAGVVLGASDQPLIVVALINHARAAQARSVLNQIIEWSASQRVRAEAPPPAQATPRRTPGPGSVQIR